ncbi:RidA family protein [Litoreibacter albidus]|uniref:RidA family protein n=1 Tax=Litoreibacter albidus TaxID=670155 RepID=UPI00373592DD
MSAPIRRQNGNGRMSQIVEHAGVIYLSGQVADPAKDITGQSTEVLRKIEDLLAAAGSDTAHILSATIWLKTMDDFPAFNAVWDAWVVAGSEPTRACGTSELANPNMLVEVMIVASKA